MHVPACLNCYNPSHNRFIIAQVPGAFNYKYIQVTIPTVIRYSSRPNRPQTVTHPAHEKSPSAKGFYNIIHLFDQIRNPYNENRGIQSYKITKTPAIDETTAKGLDTVYSTYSILSMTGLFSSGTIPFESWPVVFSQISSTISIPSVTCPKAA